MGNGFSVGASLLGKRGDLCSRPDGTDCGPGLKCASRWKGSGALHDFVKMLPATTTCQPE